MRQCERESPCAPRHNFLQRIQFMSRMQQSKPRVGVVSSGRSHLNTLAAWAGLALCVVPVIAIVPGCGGGGGGIQQTNVTFLGHYGGTVAMWAAAPASWLWTPAPITQLPVPSPSARPAVQRPSATSPDRWPPMAPFRSPARSRLTAYHSPSASAAGHRQWSRFIRSATGRQWPDFYRRHSSPQQHSHPGAHAHDQAVTTAG